MIRTACALVAACLLAVAADASAQDGASMDVRMTRVGAPGDSAWKIVLPNGVVLQVVTDGALREARAALAELAAAEQRIAILEPLQAQYERVMNACTQARTLDAQLIQLQNQQIIDYKKLSAALERLANPWFSWQAGIGRDQGQLAMMAGAGIKQARVLITAHNSQPAWFLGYSGRF